MKSFIVLVGIFGVQSLWAADLAFVCKPSSTYPMRPTARHSVTGSMSADGIPGNIVVTRTLTGAIEDTVAVATPVDNLFSRFQTRFDVTSADQGMTVNYYFLDLPALSIAQGSAFTAELDVYYDRGNGGWVQYPLDCQF